MAALAWLLLAVGSRRQHGGNSGYEDDLESCYRWDSTVPNHGKPSPGDVVALWDKRQLLGTAVIGRIEQGAGKKLVYRCANCGQANIKARATKLPLFRCFDCFAEFDQPQVRTVDVTTFAAMYGATWREAADFVPASKLRLTAVRPKAQNSIRELDWAAFASQCLDEAAVEALAAASTDVREGHVLRIARARIGQAAFRAKLLDAYGATCAMSGDCPADALEAAHLYSYAETGRHHEHGGFLLRRDLHRLFDLGLLAVEPHTLKVDVDPALSSFEQYAALAGRSLAVGVTNPQRRWLEDHWEQHRPEAP